MDVYSSETAFSARRISLTKFAWICIWNEIADFAHNMRSQLSGHISPDTRDDKYTERQDMRKLYVIEY